MNGFDQYDQRRCSSLLTIKEARQTKRVANFLMEAKNPYYISFSTNVPYKVFRIFFVRIMKYLNAETAVPDQVHIYINNKNDV